MAEEIEEVLEAVNGGSAEARERLLALVYGELRRLASAQMQRQPRHHTLQPTALLNEAWLRLMGRTEAHFNDRQHFLRAAATAMRSVLVDQARRKDAVKRGGGQRKVTLDESDHAGSGSAGEIIAVNDALERLQAEDPLMSRLVELRFFCGLSMEETAETLSIAPRTAYKVWQHARAWLYREISA